jgi:hypothetical protein
VAACALSHTGQSLRAAGVKPVQRQERQGPGALRGRSADS